MTSSQDESLHVITHHMSLLDPIELTLWTCEGSVSRSKHASLSDCRPHCRLECYGRAEWPPRVTLSFSCRITLLPLTHSTGGCVLMDGCLFWLFYNFKLNCGAISTILSFSNNTWASTEGEPTAKLFMNMFNLLQHLPSKAYTLTVSDE